MIYHTAYNQWCRSIKQDNFDGEIYYIRDSIYGSYKLDISDYYEIMDGYFLNPIQEFV